MADEVERELDVTEEDAEGQGLRTRKPTLSDDSAGPSEGIERKPTMSASDDDVEGQMFVRTRNT